MSCCYAECLIFFDNETGGQQTYVRAEGPRESTQAHSVSVPVGAYCGGWTNIMFGNVKVFTWDSVGDKAGRGILFSLSSDDHVNFLMD